MKFYTADNYDPDTHGLGTVSRTTHGMSKTLIYARWCTVRRRCVCPSSKSYTRYGGKGVGICERWLVFQNFYLDMGDPPFKGAELDRVDNTKGYCKSNCRWATKTQNINNRGQFSRKHKLPTGVYQHPSYNPPRYSAGIRIDKKYRSLGTFDTIEEASEAYQNARKIKLNLTGDF